MAVVESRYHLGQVLTRVEDGRSERKVVITQVGDGENTLTQFCYLRSGTKELTIHPVGGSVDPEMTLRETGTTLHPQQMVAAYRRGFEEMKHATLPTEFIERIIHDKEMVWESKSEI